MIAGLLNDYYEWLIDKIDNKTRTERKRYSELLRVLFETDFVWTVSRDENRYKDGINLRYLYERETALSVVYAASNKPCSVLEMLVALADCCSRLASEPGYTDTPRWFWEMLRNLGLKTYSDQFFNYDRVYEILTKWMKRKYSPSGLGGLFPLGHPVEDQRHQEIWLQFCSYVYEQMGLMEYAT